MEKTNCIKTTLTKNEYEDKTYVRFVKSIMRTFIRNQGSNIKDFKFIEEKVEHNFNIIAYENA